MTQTDRMLVAGLRVLMTQSPGVLTYQGTSVDCYRSAVRDYSRKMDPTGYNEVYDNLFVQVLTEDISSWNLVPMSSQVTLDGDAFIVGQTVTTTGAITTIYLRIKR